MSSASLLNDPKNRFRLRQRQPVLDVSRPVQNDEKQFVVETESHSLPSQSPKEDLVFLSHSCNLRDDGPSGSEDLEKKSEKRGEEGYHVSSGSEGESVPESHIGTSEDRWN